MSASAGTSGGLAAAAPSQERRTLLVVVPTGAPGHHDFSLDFLEGVLDFDGNIGGREAGKLYSTPVWGLVEGNVPLARQLEEGDLFLMTPAGTSKLKSVGVVKEVLFDCKAVGRRIWPDGLSYNMGGCIATNKQFSVMIKLKTVRLIDIDKKTMLSRLGYKDHLQSTRLIQPGTGKCEASEEELQRVVRELQDVLVQPPTREELQARTERLSELNAKLKEVNRRLSTDDAASEDKLQKEKQILKKRIKHVNVWSSSGSGSGSRSPAATPSNAMQQPTPDPEATGRAVARDPHAGNSFAPQQQQQQNGRGLMTTGDPGPTGGNDTAAPNGGVGADPKALSTGISAAKPLKAGAEKPLKWPSPASPLTPDQQGQIPPTTHSRAGATTGSPTPARQLGSDMDRAAAAAAAAAAHAAAAADDDDDDDDSTSLAVLQQQHRQQKALARSPAASPTAPAGAAAAAGEHSQGKKPAHEKLKPMMLSGVKRPRIAGLLGPVKQPDCNPGSSSSGGSATASEAAEDEPARTKRKWLVRWEQHPEEKDSWEQESRLREQCPGLLSIGLAQLVGRREAAARAEAKQRKKAEARAARAEARCAEMERSAQEAEAKALQMQSESREARLRGKEAEEKVAQLQEKSVILARQLLQLAGDAAAPQN